MRNATLVAALLLATNTASAGCPANESLAIGGRLSAVQGRESPFRTTTTYLDFTRPARTEMVISRVDFGATAYDPFTVTFEVIKPAGTGFSVKAKSDPKAFTPPSEGAFPGDVAPGPTFYSAQNLSLHFDGGDLLGVTILTAGDASLALGVSDAPGSYGALPGDVTVGATFDRALLTMGEPSHAIAAEATDPNNSLIISCVAPRFAPTELLIPITGEIDGAVAHFSTDVTVTTNFPMQQASYPVTLTLRDRTAPPESSRIVRPFTLPLRGTSAIDDLTAILQKSTFLGPLTIQLPGTGGSAGARNVSAYARITATLPSGETTMTIPAVSCNGLGRVVKLPIHVPAGHHLNVGVASAPLTSCGVYAEANAIEIAVNDGDWSPIDLSAGSVQLDDITGPGSAIRPAIGMTTGTLAIRVRDEASRIVAYGSLVDNRSQSATIVPALIER